MPPNMDLNISKRLVETAKGNVRSSGGKLSTDEQHAIVYPAHPARLFTYINRSKLYVPDPALDGMGLWYDMRGRAISLYDITTTATTWTDGSVFFVSNGVIDNVFGENTLGITINEGEFARCRVVVNGSDVSFELSDEGFLSHAKLITGTIGGLRDLVLNGDVPINDSIFGRFIRLSGHDVTWEDPGVTDKSMNSVSVVVGPGSVWRGPNEPDEEILGAMDIALLRRTDQPGWELELFGATEEDVRRAGVKQTVLREWNDFTLRGEDRDAFIQVGSTQDITITLPEVVDNTFDDRYGVVLQRVGTGDIYFEKDNALVNIESDSLIFGVQYSAVIAQYVGNKTWTLYGSI